MSEADGDRIYFDTEPELVGPGRTLGSGEGATHQITLGEFENSDIGRLLNRELQRRLEMPGEMMGQIQENPIGGVLGTAGETITQGELNRASSQMPPPNYVETVGGGVCFVGPVEIRKVVNGFIVTIGCKTFVAERWEKAAKGIGEYFADPVKAEKKYCKKS